jgi:malate dehydrogenase
MSVISVAEVERAEGVLVVGARDIVTPLALDRARELGIAVERSAANDPATPPQRLPQSPKPANGARPSLASRPSLPAPPAKNMAAAALPSGESSAPFSGALYRRGAAVPSHLSLQPVRPAPAAAHDGRPRVAVIGAGHVGAMTALRLAEPSLFASVRLIDILQGLAEGLALDMWHSAGLRRFTTRIEGSADIADVANADFIVVTAGRPRQPGMSRTDLTSVNAEIIGSVADAICQHAPRAIVVVVTNPLEEMTHLMAKRTGFAPGRVIGMAGVLDTARFCALVGLTGVARPEDVRALALGSHGPEMVIPLSQARAGERPLEDLLERDTLAAIIERTRESGAEVVKLLRRGSAYFSPAESAAAMVVAMASDKNEVMAACVQSGGAYGLADTRVGLPVRLGRSGVTEIVQLSLRPEELTALRKAATSIAARIKELG